MKAVVLTTYGDPATGLEYRDVPEPEKPGVGQVLVGVEFAPINFSDILVARGLYPLRPALPSVIGNEGVGRVLEIGRYKGGSTLVNNTCTCPAGTHRYLGGGASLRCLSN